MNSSATLSWIIIIQLWTEFVLYYIITVSFILVHYTQISAKPSDCKLAIANTFDEDNIQFVPNLSFSINNFYIGARHNFGSYSLSSFSSTQRTQYWLIRSIWAPVSIFNRTKWGNFKVASSHRAGYCHPVPLYRIPYIL